MWGKSEIQNLGLGSCCRNVFTSFLLPSSGQIPVAETNTDISQQEEIYVLNSVYLHSVFLYIIMLADASHCFLSRSSVDQSVRGSRGCPGSGSQQPIPEQRQSAALGGGSGSGCSSR